MKARPRGVENKVAEALSLFFVQVGMTPVERIPILGREGPDITTNELGLVIDVKSRLEVPQTIFFPLVGPFSFDWYLCVRLACLDTLFDDREGAMLDFTSKIVDKWYAHMEEWTAKENPTGISALVLHRPKMPIGDAVVVIHHNDRRRLQDNARNSSTNNNGNH